MASNNWYLNNGGDIRMNVSAANKYSFGFTGFNSPRGEPIYDEFELYVWETRKAAGFVEPMPEPIGYETKVWNSQVAGQILFSGTLIVTNPAKHGMVYGISSGSDQPSDE